MEDDATAITREQEYRKLVDEFYQNNKKFVSEGNYQRAKTDPAHFKVLIRKTTGLCQKIGKELLLMDRNIHVWEKQFKREK